MTPQLPDVRLLLILVSCAAIILMMARPLVRRLWWTGPAPPAGSHWRPRASTLAIAAVTAHQWPGLRRRQPYAGVDDRMFAAKVGASAVLVRAATRSVIGPPR